MANTILFLNDFFGRLLRMKKKASLVEVWCPKSHKHAVMVWTYDPAPFERGDVELSDCPEESDDA